MTDKLLTTEEAAERLNTTPRHVRRLVFERRIAYVKLGHPFIDDLATDNGQRRLIWSTVLKAHRLGQRVIAQGVEDLATLEQLADLGIDEAQGYALGPPESLESALSAPA